MNNDDDKSVLIKKVEFLSQFSCTIFFTYLGDSNVQTLLHFYKKYINFS